MANVFISYKREDRDRVALIEKCLKDQGLTCWFDAALDLGHSDGFNAQIERELASAGAVLVCWTTEATRSKYINGEALKGLDRKVLVPIFLEPCDLPVPFNGIDTANLAHWYGNQEDQIWNRVLKRLDDLKSKSELDQEASIARSVAAYETIDEQIFPGTLKSLTRKIVALHDLDADKYHDDISSILEWIEAILAKETKYVEDGYKLAERQPGGGAWNFWEKGDASARCNRLLKLENKLEEIDCLLQRSKKILDLPSP